MCLERTSVSRRRVPLRLVVGWQEANGYMAACWRALAETAGIDLMIIAGRPGVTQANNIYAETITSGLDCKLLDRESLTNDTSQLRRLVVDFRPDVVFLPGWFSRAFCDLAFCSELADARFLLGFDTTRTDTWSQRLVRLRIGRLLKRIELAIVPGERGWQFATKVLKLPEHKVRRGLYGVDAKSLAESHLSRLTRREEWPQQFLFVGQYIERKGIDVLLSAYRQYRKEVSSPWPLLCCGHGPFSKQIGDTEGAEDRGFVQPSQLPAVLGEAGVAVLPSRHDAWPLALVEAMAAGLPVICSEACGSGVELVRPYYNGLQTATGDPESLCRALTWVSRHPDFLPKMGLHARTAAAAYSAEAWAARFREYIDEVVAR